jgi:hypothetical protein
VRSGLPSCCSILPFGGWFGTDSDELWLQESASQRRVLPAKGRSHIGGPLLGARGPRRNGHRRRTSWRARGSGCSGRRPLGREAQTASSGYCPGQGLTFCRRRHRLGYLDHEVCGDAIGLLARGGDGRVARANRSLSLGAWIQRLTVRRPRARTAPRTVGRAGLRNGGRGRRPARGTTGTRLAAGARMLLGAGSGWRGCQCGNRLRSGRTDLRLLEACQVNSGLQHAACEARHPAHH